MTARLHHTAVPVRLGRMLDALGFMREFGFKKEDYEVHGAWGFAYFVINKWGDRVQLTLPSDQSNDATSTQTMLPHVHVGLGCDVDKMRKQIVTLAEKHNLTVVFESVPGGKLFVSIPQVFWIDIELVPLI